VTVVCIFDSANQEEIRRCFEEAWCPIFKTIYSQCKYTRDFCLRHMPLYSLQHCG